MSSRKRELDAREPTKLERDGCGASQMSSKGGEGRRSEREEGERKNKSIASAGVKALGWGFFILEPGWN